MSLSLGVAGEDAVDIHAVQRGLAQATVVHARRGGHGADHHLAGDVVRLQQPAEAGGGVGADALATVDVAGQRDPRTGAGTVDQDQRDVHGRGTEVNGDGAGGLAARLGPQRANDQCHVVPRSGPDAAQRGALRP